MGLCCSCCSFSSSISRKITSCGFFLFGFLGRPNPRKYLYILSDKQIKIIISKFDLFHDIKFVTLQTVPFSLEEKPYQVREGFMTDGVSSGCRLSHFIGIDTAIAHDFLYATHPTEKDSCDNILHPTYRRLAVSTFGESSWQSSGQRGALFINQDNEGHTCLKLYRNAQYDELVQETQLSEEEEKHFLPYFVRRNSLMCVPIHNDA
jgi:hypothetical protein